MSAEGELKNPGPDRTEVIEMQSLKKKPLAEIVGMPEGNDTQYGTSRTTYRSLGPLKRIKEVDEEAAIDEDIQYNGSLGKIIEEDEVTQAEDEEEEEEEEEEDEESFKSVDVVVHDYPRDD